MYPYWARCYYGPRNLPAIEGGSMAEEGDVIPLEVMKVVVVGDAGVGKTSLVRRYTQGEYQDDYVSTVALEYDNKVMDVEGHTAKLHIWDSSGQENFFSMVEKQVKEADGFIFVFDVTNKATFDSIGRRLKKIQACAKERRLPMVLIANKCDLRHKQVIAECHAKEYGIPEGMKVMEASAKTAKHVTAAFYTLALDIYKYRRLGVARKIAAARERTVMEPPELYIEDSVGKMIDNGPEYTHLFKILIVGSPRVGKTSLRFRFCRDYFTSEYFPTPGSDYDARTLMVDEEKCKVQVWDVAGDERYQQTRRSYYKGANGFIILYDVNSPKSFEKAEMLLKEMDMLGQSDAPKILVGNKCDMNGKKKVSEETSREFADGWRIPEVRVSARTGENVTLPFTKLAEALKRQCAPWKRIYDFS